MLGSGAGEGRLYAEAVLALEELDAEATRTDDDASEAYGRAWLARIAFELGDYDEAERLASPGPPISGHGFSGPMTALGAKGRVQVRRGDEAASVTLTTTIGLRPNPSLQYVWSPLCGLAELAWLEGRVEGIPRVLEPILAK